MSLILFLLRIGDFGIEEAESARRHILRLQI